LLILFPTKLVVYPSFFDFSVDKYPLYLGFVIQYVATYIKNKHQRNVTSITMYDLINYLGCFSLKMDSGGNNTSPCISEWPHHPTPPLSLTSIIMVIWSSLTLKLGAKKEYMKKKITIYKKVDIVRHGQLSTK